MQDRKFLVKDDGMKYTKRQIEEAIAYWEKALREDRKLAINESQNAGAKRSVLEAAFGWNAPAGKVSVTLNAHFIRNGNHCYDSLYATDAPFSMEITELDFDDVQKRVAFTCSDANGRTSPVAMSYRRVAMEASLRGFRFGECRKAELKLGHSSINVMDPKAQIEFDGNVLTVTYDKEFWVTDNSFFDAWSDQLWNNDGWSDARDEETAFYDVCEKFIGMLDQVQWHDFCEQTGLDEQDPGSIEEVMDNPEAADALQELYSGVNISPLHLPGRKQSSRDKEIARRMIQSFQNNLIQAN